MKKSFWITYEVLPLIPFYAGASKVYKVGVVYNLISNTPGLWESNTFSQVIGLLYINFSSGHLLQVSVVSFSMMVHIPQGTIRTMNNVSLSDISWVGHILALPLVVTL